MEDVQYIEGNKKARIVLMLFLVFWMLIGIILEQYIEFRLEEIQQIQDTIIAMKEMKSLHLWTTVLPWTLFFTIIAAITFYIGFVILKQKQHPPIGISMPFRAKFMEGEKSKYYSYGYMLGAGLSLITVFLNFMLWVFIYGL
jgi:hypothetical protein